MTLDEAGGRVWEEGSPVGAVIRKGRKEQLGGCGGREAGREPAPGRQHTRLCVTLCARWQGVGAQCAARHQIPRS